MRIENFKSERGQISKIIIILAGAVLLVTIVVFLAVKFFGSGRLPTTAKKDTTQEETEPPKPVYEITIGDIKFVMQSSVNLGSVLESEYAYGQDKFTTDRFIKVTVSAQNKGKVDTAYLTWEVGNIIDSEGRIFPPNRQTYQYLPQPDLCGAILKPEFTPVFCVRIHEVSNKSTDLKIEVINKAQKRKELLDLNLAF